MRNYSIIWIDAGVRKRQDFDYIPASQWDGVLIEGTFRIPKDGKMDGL